MTRSGSVAAAQASEFYERIVRCGEVFTFTDDGDYLVFPIGGLDVVPFWSTESRLVKVQQLHPKYAKWKIERIDLQLFLTETLPKLESESIHLGINWSGQRLTGYDISVADLRRNIAHWQSSKVIDG